MQVAGSDIHERVTAALRGTLARLMRGRVGTWLALLAFGLVVLAPGCQHIPATDRDESRYAQAARQIVESGEWGDIRFQDELRLKKPPGIYWLQAGLQQALGLPDTIASHRLPSLLGALGSLLLLLALARRCLDARFALLPPLALAVSFLLGAEARLATTDAVLLLTTLAAAGVLTLRLTGRPWRHDDLILAGALAAGVLVKGPVIILLVAGMAAVALLLRRAGCLRPLLTWRAALLFVTLALPWFWLIAARHGAAFWQDSLVHDVAGKAIGAQESHGQPPGFYLLTLPLAGWPWAALLPAIGWLAWHRRGEPLVLALLAWILPFWCVFELAPTKLVHYVLPTYPAFALLAALAWQARDDWPVWVRRACIALLLFGAIALAVASGMLVDRFGGAVWASALFVGTLLVAVAGFFWRKAALTWLLLGAGLAYAQFWGVLVPSLQALWLSERLATLTAPWRPACDAPTVADGFVEPSLVFELGTDLRLGAPGPLPLGATCRVRLSREPLAGDHLRPLGTVGGFNYAKGRAIEVHAYLESAQ